MKFRKNYQLQNWDKGLENNEPSMCKPEYASDLDTNNIMKRYVETGYLPPADAGPMFQDLTVIPNFDQMQDKILNAQRLFLDLPLSVKDEFRSAEELLKAFQSKSGLARLESVGLIQKKTAEPKVPELPGSGAGPQEAPKGAPAS